MSLYLRYVADAPTGNMDLLGDEFTTLFRVQLFGSQPNRLYLFWRTNVEFGGEYLAPSVLQPGFDYHIASSIGPNFGFRVWLNGVLVHSSADPEGLVSGNNRRIEVGREDGDATSREVLIDDPALWAGYELTEANVLALRDRTATPLEIGGAALGFYWTLNGADDVPVTLESAGVQDLSGNSRHAVGISDPAPLYSSIEPQYIEPLPVQVKSASMSASGKTLIIYLEDPSGNPRYPTASNTLPTLTVNGAAATIIGPLWDADTLHIAYPLLGTTVVPSDTVTLSAAKGWLEATTPNFDPEVEALDNAPVSTADIGLLTFPEPTGDRTLQLGWNLYRPGDFTPPPMYSNLYRQCRGHWSTSSGSPVFTLNEDDTLATLSGGTVHRWLLSPHDHLPNTANQGGTPLVPAGRFTLRWVGSSELSLYEILFGAAQNFLVSDDYNGTNKLNTRTYDIPIAGDQYCHLLALRFHGVDYDESTIEVLPPDPEHPATLSLSGASKFHPEFLRIIGPAANLRSLNSFLVNHSNVRRYAEEMEAPRNRYTLYRYHNTPTVTRVDPWTNNGFFHNNRITMKFTTDGPHGLLDGDNVSILELTEPIEVVGGTTLEGVWIGGSTIHVLSATEFAYGQFSETGDAGKDVVARTLSTGYAQRELALLVPPSDLLELCGTVGADPWICVPHLMDNESVTAWATDVADWLAGQPASRKVWVEYSNEVWLNSFQQTFYAYAMGSLAGISGGNVGRRWYGRRSGEIHNLFEAAMEARQVGLSAGLKRVYATQGANSGETTSTIQEAFIQGYRVDAIAVAPYLNVTPRADFNRDTWAQCDIDHVMDLDAETMKGPQIYVFNHQDALAAHYDHASLGFPQPEIICYEGGIENAVRDHVDTTANSFATRLTIHWSRHPRMYNHTFRQFTRMEAAGVTLFNYYLLNGSPQYSSQANVWSVYTGSGQRAGRGNGSDGLNNNLNDLNDIPNLVVPVAGAFETWMATATPPVEPDPPQCGPAHWFSPRRNPKLATLFKPKTPRFH